MHGWAGTLRLNPGAKAEGKNNRWQCAFLLVCLALFILMASAQPSLAQAEDTQDVSTETTRELEALVQTLENDQERQELIGQLRRLIEAQNLAQQEEDKAKSAGLGGQILNALSQRVSAITAQFLDTIDMLSVLPAELSGLWTKAQEPGALQRWAEIISKIVLVLALGFIAEWILNRLLAKPRQVIEQRQRQFFFLKLFYLIIRSLLDVLPIGAFAAATYLVLPLLDPKPETRLVALAIINANVLARVILALGRMVIAPNAGSLRLFTIEDENAAYFYVWLRRLVSIGVYGYFAAEAALLLGLAPGAYHALLKVLGLILAAMAIVLVLQNKALLSSWLRSPKPEEGKERLEEKPRSPFAALRERLADIWHILAVALIVSLYGSWLLEIPGGFQFLAKATALTALIVIAATVLFRMVDALVERGFRVDSDYGVRFPLLQHRLNRYLPVFRGIVKGVIAVFGALIVLDAWGLGTLEWLASESGTMTISHFVTSATIIIAALVIWEVLSSLIEHVLHKENENGEGHKSQRLLTLLPLLRNAARVTLVVMVSLIVLSELGLNIAPLLAGAGVVGLAIGFGAQTLVKDVITGTFILIENSLAVGDWVDLGSHSGTVEELTIRTVTLRDREGTVHVIPFGDVTSVVNYNRDYGHAVMVIGVAYREDVDQVIEVLKEIGEGMQKDEEFGPSILEPLYVFGLNNLGESSLDIMVRFKTKAMMQWIIRREFLKRTKKVFDERGIEIPFPHRTIYFGVDKEGKAPPAYVQPLASSGPESLSLTAAQTKEV